ncbi:hypothetical protein KY289_031904 [Solanum tuberosum]|nr:hypothetical protein KY289_031904 [Solanum tuberosum]
MELVGRDGENGPFSRSSDPRSRTLPMAPVGPHGKNGPFSRSNDLRSRRFYEPIDFSGNIPKVFYQDLPGSPTASEMEPPKEKPAWLLGMLKTGKTFESNPDILHEQWIHPNNQVKRKWYASTYTLNQRESFRDLWMADMRRIGCEMEFFKWFEMTGRIENCTESLQVIINKWYTASNKVVEWITPPLEGINIPIAGTVIKSSHFKEKSDKTGSLLTFADIDRVVEQNNYSNQILHVISRQIEDTKPTISGRPTPASTSSSHNIETYPGFKIPEFSKEKFPKLSDLLNKPSFPDLQYEENAFLSTSSHEGRSITEWNIDGLVEHQVYNKLHEMGVAITAYKMRNSTDKDAANMIIAGFTGMLKHWWDNYCTDEVKHLIINATATETVVKMEGNTQSTANVVREDACATLLYHIAKHFIGEPKLFQDRSLQILSNLSCPNLDNFIHYRHAFLSKVMIRPDCNLDFWKERFISGLPPLFADKVRTKIQDRNNGNIPYGNLTYGDLVSTINVVALELCTDIKLKHQLKKEQSSSRKELGSFCRDFGFITPPDKIKKDKREKSHRKKSRRRDDSTRTSKKKHRSKRPRDTKTDVCWTCGKTGHKASECRSGAKKKKINLLGMDEETKGKLLAILDEPFSESSGTSDEYSDDEDIDLDYDSDKSQSGRDCTCTEAFCTCDSTPYIRVLSDHSKEALFDVIQHINDNEARNRFLLELKNLLLNTDKPKPRPIIEPFSMKQVMNRSGNHSEPSISDLRHEVSSLKEEIRSIKSRLCIVETDILTNQVPERTTFHDLESNQDSDDDNIGIDNVGIDLSNINNDHPVEPLVTNTGNDTSTSAAPGVTHLNTFFKVVKNNGLVVSAKKMVLFQTSIRFLGHDLYQGSYKPICRAIEFSSKFPNEIPDKTQLQRFLGSLNYVADFIPKVRQTCEPLYKRLRKNPIPWGTEQTQAVIQVKALVQTIPCLGIPNPDAFMIVETDASDAGYGGILKQKVDRESTEQLVRFTSGIWNSAQKNYSTVKKEVLSIVLCITKFQDDLINKEFLLRVDCKSAKEILQKDVKNLVSKQIFARWQALLSSFDFEIEFIKGENNSLPDFLTREFLQGKHEAV